MLRHSSSPNHFMLILYFLLLFLDLFAVGFYFERFASVFDVESYGFIVIMVHSAIVLLGLVIRQKRYRNMIIAGFLLRLFLLFADYYHWFPILNSGGDTEAFHQIATLNVLSPEESITLTNYTTFLTFLYSITHSCRMIAQYINVLFGVGIILMLSEILQCLNVSKKAERLTLGAVVFLPNMIIFSAILLREAWVEFFVTASVLFFIRWFQSGKMTNIIMVIISLLNASYMHSGVLGLMMGYVVAFLTYNPRTHKVQLSASTIGCLCILAVSCILFLKQADLFTDKFQSFDFESEDDFLNKINTTSGGGADYLTWINTDNFVVGLLFAPLKMFYFLFSPLPTEWRGLNDLIGFLMDGAIYMWLCWIIYKNQTKSHLTLLKKYLTTALLVVTFVFAYGTSNAGTAFRHRAKIFPLLAVIFATSYRKRHNGSYVYTIPPSASTDVSF